MTNLKRMIIGSLGFLAITLLPGLASAQDSEDLKNLSGIRCGCEADGASGSAIQVGSSMVMFGGQIGLSDRFRAPDGNDYLCRIKIQNPITVGDGRDDGAAYYYKGYLRQSQGKWRQSASTSSSEFSSGIKILLVQDNSSSSEKDLVLSYQFDASGRPFCRFELKGGIFESSIRGFLMPLVGK